MADTRQCVTWTLAHPCQLRTGDDWFLPMTTWRQLNIVQYCAEELSRSNPQVHDGILVTSHLWANDKDGNRVDLPSSGIPIHEIAKPFNGWPKLRKTCANCPANTTAVSAIHKIIPAFANSKQQPVVAGCFGNLEPMIRSEESFDQLLWHVIDQHGLQRELEFAFQLTTPLWYGLWMESPLSDSKCRALLLLFSKAVEELEDESSEFRNHPSLDKRFYVSSKYDPIKEQCKEYRTFIGALDRSIKHDIPLHVHLSPPGHTDFGMYTQFSHCPKCKCAADVPRWQDVESETYVCTACGNTFDPAESRSSSTMGGMDDRDSLENMLGAEYDSFAVQYGIKQGYSEHQITQALDLQRDGPATRQVERIRTRIRQSHERLESAAAKRTEQPPSTVRLELDDDVEIEFLLVKTGQFLMGEEPLPNRSFDKSTLPIHKVTISRPFYLARFPITQKQWGTIMKENPSRCRVDNHPVEQVSWILAQEFCLKLSKKTKRIIRLPSEAEWEYACRAGTTTRHYTGQTFGAVDGNLDFTRVDEDPLDFDFMSEASGKANETTPVDAYPPNPWGFFDMIGNVREWCDDYWHDNYDGAPADGSSWLSPPERLSCVARGGACDVNANQVSPAARFPQHPEGGGDPFQNGEERECITGTNLRVYFGLRPVLEIY